MGGHRFLVKGTGAAARLLAVVVLIAGIVAGSPQPASAADRTLSGIVQDHLGNPLAGARVRACPGTTVTQNCADGVTSEPSTSGTGAYSMTLTDSSYGVLAFFDSPQGRQLSSQAVIAAGAAASSQDFQVPLRTRLVTGSVRGVGGSVVPISGVSVCPGATWAAGCAGGSIAPAPNDTGDFQIYVLSGVEHQFRPYGYGGLVTGTVQTVSAGIDPVHGLSFQVDDSDVRTITGKVLAADGIPVAPHVANATQVWLCPVANGSTGGCAGRLTAFTDEAGNYSLYAKRSVAYNVQGVSYAMHPVAELPGGVRSMPFELAALNDATVALADITLQHDLVRGTVSRTGWTTFPANTIGVGACPQPNVATGAECFGLQSSFAAADGSYTLALPVLPNGMTFNVSGFMFVDGVLVIGPAEIGRVVQGGSTFAMNYTADVADAPASTTEPLVLQPPDPSLGTITVDAGGLPIFNAVAVAAGDFVTEPAPETAWGALSFTVQVVNPGDTVTVTLDFEKPIPVDATFHKLSLGAGPNGTAAWVPFSGFTRVNAQQATLTVTDGGAGDYDGVANGFITDPVYAEVTQEKVYDVAGFAKPLKSGSNRVRAGSTIPAKWQVTEGGVAVDSPSSFESLTISACGGSEVVVADPTLLTSLGSGSWQLSVATTRAMRGCAGEIVLLLADGSELTATLQLR